MSTMITDTAELPTVGRYDRRRPMRSDVTANALLRLPTSIASRVRIAAYRALGMGIGPRCRLARIDVPRHPSAIRLDVGVAVDRDVTLLVLAPATAGRPRIHIGRNAYINRNVFIDAAESIAIADDVMIGPFTYITDHDHGTTAGGPTREQPITARAVTIEANAWIGAHASILKGVRVGRDAVVGAGAVVTHDVPPEAIVAGVPARIIGWRRNGGGAPTG
jgi:maltose O-acetyltransferase